MAWCRVLPGLEGVLHIGCSAQQGKWELLERLEHCAASTHSCGENTQSELGIGPEEAASPDGLSSVQSLLGYGLIFVGDEQAVGRVSRSTENP